LFRYFAGSSNRDPAIEIPYASENEFQGGNMLGIASALAGRERMGKISCDGSPSFDLVIGNNDPTDDDVTACPWLR
jgi:hypothetical protein